MERADAYSIARVIAKAQGIASRCCSVNAARAFGGDRVLPENRSGVHRELLSSSVISFCLGGLRDRTDPRQLVGLDSAGIRVSLAASMDERPADRPPVPPPVPATAIAAKKPPPVGVRLETLQVDSGLATRRLAAWWQRAAAMVIDWVTLGALSLLAGAVLGFFTGLTIAALGSRDISATLVWRSVRWIFWCLGGAVMLTSALLMLGQPILRTGAFNVDRAMLREAERSEAVLPPSPTYRQLEAYADQLAAENRKLRDSVRGSSWLNAVTDFSRTVGLTFGWAGVYFTLCTAWWRGRTLGKFVFGTRVVRLDGRPLTTMDTFTRYGGYAAGLATGMIGFARLLWDPNRQAIEDKIAGTVVVRRR